MWDCAWSCPGVSLRALASHTATVLAVHCQAPRPKGVLHRARIQACREAAEPLTDPASQTAGRHAGGTDLASQACPSSCFLLLLRDTDSTHFLHSYAGHLLRRSAQLLCSAGAGQQVNSCCLCLCSTSSRSTGDEHAHAGHAASPAAQRCKRQDPCCTHAAAAATAVPPVQGEHWAGLTLRTARLPS